MSWDFKLTEKENEALQALTLAVVEKVYTGKDGRCCCGCSGKFYEPTANPKEALRVLRLVQAAGEDADCGGNNFAAVDGKKLYIVYLAGKTIEDAINYRKAKDAATKAVTA